MPLYINPDFRRLTGDLAAIFASTAQDSFFALPAWYDLMSRHGVPATTEIRVYTDERPRSSVAVVLQATVADAGRRLASLASFYSVEHGIICRPETDRAAGLAAILAEILSELPSWDCLSFAELDPHEASYAALVGALRHAGLFVECMFHSGTWYEDTTAMRFADYVAALPAPLRNTWRRKCRAVDRGCHLTKAFFAAAGSGLDQAIADYETIYRASWKPEEASPRLIPALIRLAAELGALRLGIYHIDGIPAAAQFWILWNGRAVIYKLAHDNRFDALSLGTLLTMEMTERVLENDRPREINFGRGDDPYKRLWLPRRRERWGITAANPRTRRGLRLGLTREAAKIYHRLRGERITPFG